MSRLGVAAVAALLVALVGLAVAGPWRDAVEDAEARAALAELRLARAEALVARRQDGPLPRDPGLLPDLSEAQAAAFLQDRVARIAMAAEFETAGMQVLAREDQGALRRIGLRLRGTGDMASLAKLVHALEAETTPLILVETLRLQARAAAGTVEVQLDAIAFMPRGGT